MTRIPALASMLSGLLVSVSVAFAAPVAPTAEPEVAAEYVRLCTERLALDAEQSASLASYLEQEMQYMDVQRANHTAAEVAELLPAQRAELQQVASRLMSPTQLRRFRELNATPQMKDYLRQMSLE